MQGLQELVFVVLALGVVIGYGALVLTGMTPEGALAYTVGGALIVGLFARTTIGILSVDLPEPIAASVVVTDPPGAADGPVSGAQRSPTERS